MSEQRLESSEIAVLYGCEEPTCELLALFSCRFEAGPTLLDVTPGAESFYDERLRVLGHTHRVARFAVRRGANTGHFSARMRR